MQKCSYCGRENDEAATHCTGCGTTLLSESVHVEPVQNAIADPQRAQGERLMLQGTLWALGGLVVTVFSYSAAVSSPYGGHYVIAYGAIIFGIRQFLRGRAMASGYDSHDRAQELLDAAAHLESVDRVRAIALYAQIAKEFPGTRSADEAQRNIQTLTRDKDDNQA